MSPQAGATLAHLGTTPANKAPAPSVLIMWRQSGIVDARWFSASGAHEGEGVNTCRLVLSTSNGCVRSAAIMPDNAPEVKLIPMGDKETGA